MGALVMFTSQKNLHTNMHREQHFLASRCSQVVLRETCPFHIRWIDICSTIQTDLGVQNQMITFPDRACFQFSHFLANEDRNHRELFTIDSLPEKHFPTRHAFLQALLFI